MQGHSGPAGRSREAWRSQEMASSASHGLTSANRLKQGDSMSHKKRQPPPAPAYPSATPGKSVKKERPEARPKLASLYEKGASCRIAGKRSLQVTGALSQPRKKNPIGAKTVFEAEQRRVSCVAERRAKGAVLG